MYLLMFPSSVDLNPRDGSLTLCILIPLLWHTQLQLPRDHTPRPNLSLTCAIAARNRNKKINKGSLHILIAL